jgi:hypothetical protein
MKIRRTLTSGAVAVLALAATVNYWPAESADSQSPIVGTWQVTSISAQALNTKQNFRPFGDHPIGYLQYSPGGHVVVVMTAGELLRPATADYTDAERSDIFKGVNGAYAGTYRLEGNKVTHHVLTAWRPDLIGVDLIRYFEINDKSLTIKTAPFGPWPAGYGNDPGLLGEGRDWVVTLTFAKVE